MKPGPGRAARTRRSRRGRILGAASPAGIARRAAESRTASTSGHSPLDPGTRRARIPRIPRGGSITQRSAELPSPSPASLLEMGKVLDNFHVPTRYPNGHPEGPPYVHYGPLQSNLALDHADQILAFVRAAMAGA